MYNYRWWPDKTLLSVGAPVCLSLIIDASNEKVELVPQLDNSARVRSWLPGAYWAYIGNPKNGAEVTKDDPSAGGWDGKLELRSSQQRFDHQRQRGAGLWYPKEVKRNAYSRWPDAGYVGAQQYPAALGSISKQKLHRLGAPAFIRTYSGQFL